MESTIASIARGSIRQLNLEEAISIDRYIGEIVGCLQRAESKLFWYRCAYTNTDWIPEGDSVV